MNPEKDTRESAPLLVEEEVTITWKQTIVTMGAKPLSKAKKYLGNLGPGLTTGAADDDPSGIATYSQTGAQYGFQFLWLSVFTFPLMAVIQEMCARIGIVTGEGLAANIRRRYAPWLLYLSAGLLFGVNAFNLGADLGAMAEAVRLLLPRLPFGLVVLVFAVLSLILQIFTTYANYAKYLKYLTFALLGYIATAFLVDIDWHSVLWSTFIPTFHFTQSEILLVAAILGTTISPYLFFWQTSQEVEEEILHGRATIEERRAAVVPADLSGMKSDVWSGMFFSNLVMFFIIAVCAATLGREGFTYISSAADAAEALRPLAGDFAYALFALGIIGTGMLAIPVLAGSASYALSESFRWKTGLYLKLKDAYGFYGVITVSIGVGLLLNFVGIDPLRALIYSAVGNALIAPVLLFFIVRISGDSEIMGQYVNSPLTRVIGWGTVGLMTLVAGATLISFL